MDIKKFLLDHIDTIIGVIVSFFGGMQLEKIIIKNKNKVVNSPGTTINNGGINDYKNKK